MTEQNKQSDTPAPEPQDHGVVDDWFSKVASFFIKHGMLDARDEYDISDVMTALDDNYAPDEPRRPQNLDPRWMSIGQINEAITALEQELRSRAAVTTPPQTRVVG